MVTQSTDRNKDAKLTDEQRLRYLTVYEGARCPFCGAYNMDTIDRPQVIDDTEVTLELRCSSCKKEWRDIFRLHDVQDIED